MKVGADIIDKARVMTYHRRLLGGTHAEDLGWHGQADQNLRFEALCKWGDLSGCSILDLGCGYGDLKPYLDARFAGIEYLGLDFLPEFVAEARRLLGGLPMTYFGLVDFLHVDLPKMDVGILCGSMNYHSADMLQTHTLIARIWGTVLKGMAFNLLDRRHFTSNHTLQSHDKEEILAFCRTLDPFAEIIEGYLPEDFTVLMHK